jgi:hypothetical protein
METADARGAGALGERGQQSDADAPVLPAVDDLDRDLGGVELVEPDVPGDPDRGPRRRRVRDQRHVVPVVDIEESAELARSERRLRGEVALVA